AARVIGILHKLHRPCDTRTNTIRLRADHHDHVCAARRQEPRESIHEVFLAIAEKGFGKPHAARFSGGEYDSCNHFVSTTRASARNTDMDSARQFEAAFRRTAIISAATEIAISSGEIAPISNPMGA